MKISVIHSVLGEGVLTDENAASSYGLPVFVRDNDGLAYGPGDSDGYLSRGLGVVYIAEEQEWLDRQLSQPESPVKWRNRPGRPPGTTKPDVMRYRTIRMTDEEWDYCLSQGNASNFIREMIDKARLGHPRPS